MTTKKKSGRLVLLLGILLVVVLIIVGYVLLTGGAQGLGGLGLTPPPPTALPEKEILVPKETIYSGTYISPTLLTTFEYTRVAQVGVVAQADVITSKSQIQGMVAKDDLPAGQPMRKIQFVEAGLSFRVPQGKRAFPVEVDRYTGIVGRIAEKDHVDVILSGVMELYFPEEFPLCQTCQLPNSCPQEICKRYPKTEIEPFRLLSTKTLIEDVEVLEVISLTVETPKNVTPTPGPAKAPAGWILILAVDTQQAEVLKFAKDQGMSTQFLLRRRGDTGTLTTTGITTWILIDTYKMPRPRAIPYEIPAGFLPAGVIP